MFKGQKLICTNNSSYSVSLSIGKEYEVLDFIPMLDGYTVQIMDDTEETYWYFSSIFQPAPLRPNENYREVFNEWLKDKLDPYRHYHVEGSQGSIYVGPKV